MDIAIQAARNQIAQSRMFAAAEILAERFGLREQVEALRAVRSNEPDIYALKQREALANLFEALVGESGEGIANEPELIIGVEKHTPLAPEPEPEPVEPVEPVEPAEQTKPARTRKAK